MSSLSYIKIKIKYKFDSSIYISICIEQNTISLSKLSLFKKAINRTAMESLAIQSRNRRDTKSNSESTYDKKFKIYKTNHLSNTEFCRRS